MATLSPYQGIGRLDNPVVRENESRLPSLDARCILGIARIGNELTEPRGGRGVILTSQLSFNVAASDTSGFDQSIERIIDGPPLSRYLNGQQRTELRGEEHALEWQELLLDERPSQEMLVAENDELERRGRDLRAALTTLGDRERDASVG